MAEFEKLLEASKAGDLETARKVLEDHPESVNGKDETGATALHYAAFFGHCELVRLLVKCGGEINARDDRFGATPTGWAIEYLRELGGLLGVELRDFAYAIERRDIVWVRRFLERFPSIAQEKDPDGRPLRLLASQSGDPEIAKLFGSETPRD
jgi:ankyrin repeat protein